MKIKYGDPVSLKGFLYIKFTGAYDNESGLPIAEHPSGTDCVDDETADECVVGWLIKGFPGEAKFLYHSGVNDNDHPVWIVNRVDIPQPGSYTHFHWVTLYSTDPRVDQEEFPEECNVTSAGELEPDAVNFTCPGWFLQIRAVRRFAFEHGGETIPLRPGIDNKSHLNLVTNYRPDLVITPTR